MSYAVMVFDKARTGEPDGTRLIEGFATVAAARAYAIARLRDSIEELRRLGITAEELRLLWQVYGEECKVLGEEVRASDAIGRYLVEPATARERDWLALAPDRGG